MVYNINTKIFIYIFQILKIFQTFFFKKGRELIRRDREVLIKNRRILELKRENRNLEADIEVLKTTRSSLSNLNKKTQTKLECVNAVLKFLKHAVDVEARVYNTCVVCLQPLSTVQLNCTHKYCLDCICRLGEADNTYVQGRCIVCGSSIIHIEFAVYKQEDDERYASLPPRGSPEA